MSFARSITGIVKGNATITNQDAVTQFSSGTSSLSSGSSLTLENLTLTGGLITPLSNVTSTQTANNLNVTGTGTIGTVSTPNVTTANNMTLTATNGTITLNPATKTTTADPVEITNATASTSKTTGALLVTGGAGVQGTITSAKSAPDNIEMPNNSALSCKNTNGEVVNCMQLKNSANNMVLLYDNALIVRKDMVDTSAFAILGDTATGYVSVSCTQASTGTTTGAFRVTGGVGIGGSVNVGGNVVLSNGQIQKCTRIQSNGAWGIAIGNTISIEPDSKTTTAKPFEITNATASSSKTTGALLVSGGIGCNGTINCATLQADNLNYTSASGSLTSLTTSLIDTASGDLTLTPAAKTTTSKDVDITSTTASSSKTTGALKVAGGIGCNGTITCATLNADTVNFNAQASTFTELTATTKVRTPLIDTASGDLTLTPAGKTTTSKAVAITDSTSSSSTGTGALTVSGGLGVAGSLNVGGSATIGGAVNLTGAGGCVVSYNLRCGSLSVDTATFVPNVQPLRAGSSVYSTITGSTTISLRKFGDMVMINFTSFSDNTNVPDISRYIFNNVLPAGYLPAHSTVIPVYHHRTSTPVTVGYIDVSGTQMILWLNANQSQATYASYCTVLGFSGMYLAAAV